MVPNQRNLGTARDATADVGVADGTGEPEGALIVAFVGMIVGPPVI